jgi:hypothetical protein
LFIHSILALLDLSAVANLSSAEPSSFLGAKGFPGKISDFSHCTLACKDLVDLFHLLGSTEKPIILATFLRIPATLTLTCQLVLWHDTLLWGILL